MHLAFLYQRPRQSDSDVFDSDRILPAFRQALAELVRRPYDPAAWRHEENLYYPSLVAQAIVLMGREMSASDLRSSVAYVGSFFDNAQDGGANLMWLARNTFDAALAGVALDATSSHRSDYDDWLWDSRTAMIQTMAINRAGVAPDAVRFAQSPEDRESGIQPDFSFHQHCSAARSLPEKWCQLSSGQYGVFMLDYAAEYLAKLDGTPYALPAATERGVVDWVVESFPWMFRGRYLDPATMSRRTQGKSPGSSAAASWHDTSALFGYALPKLVSLGGPRTGELERLLRRVNSRDADPADFPWGNRYFWSSDYATHHRSGFFTSVHMSSLRMSGNETGERDSGNGPWNHHMGDGVNLLVRSGSEYIRSIGGSRHDVYRFWNWRMLPGVTAEQQPSGEGPNEGLPQNSYFGSRGTHEYVGGLNGEEGTHDGYGLAAMQFSELGTEDPTRISIDEGFKSWFFFDDEYVALGSDIDASGALQPVFTTLQQSWASASPARVFDGKRVSTWDPDLAAVTHSPHWVHHDDVGYVFPSSDQNGVSSEVWTRTSPNRVLVHPTRSAPSTSPADIFTLWVDHGSGPTNAGYAYVVVPNVSGSDHQLIAQLGLYRGTARPIQIMRRDARAHAVYHRELGLHMAAIWPEGAGYHIEVGNGMTVRANHPVVLMASVEGGFLRISVADPTQGLDKVELYVNRELQGDRVTFCTTKFSTSCRLTLPLPTGDDAGSTVSYSQRLANPG